MNIVKTINDLIDARCQINAPKLLGIAKRSKIIIRFVQFFAWSSRLSSRAFILSHLCNDKFWRINMLRRQHNDPECPAVISVRPDIPLQFLKYFCLYVSFLELVIQLLEYSALSLKHDQTPPWFFKRPLNAPLFIVGVWMKRELVCVES